MILPKDMQGQSVAVMGLARSGLSVARALARVGADVSAWDDDPARRTAASDEGLSIQDLSSRDWSRTKMLVWSPGIPHEHPRPHPVALAARRAHCPVVCDLELLWRSQNAAQFVGITGTNGKSTTTALIAHILEQTGRSVAAGGNIGQPAMTLEPFGADGTYVLEMSSYQLDLVPTLRFDVAVLLNVSVDHLDRHGGMHAYVAAKTRIFDGPGQKMNVAVVGIDDSYSRHVATALKREAQRRVIPVSSQRPATGGVSGQDGRLIDDIDGTKQIVADLTAIATLPGSHNWQNAAAAYAVARAVGVPAEDAVAALRSYPGLPHRQELVATINGVRYVNDSKATNAESAARALACYDTIYWIAGGLPKEGGIGSLTGFFPRLRQAFLIGQAADAFEQTIRGRVAVTRCGDLATATAQAHALAQRERRTGAVVLLSPACASFDQWPSFEARGDAFRTIVGNLAEGAAA